MTQITLDQGWEFKQSSNLNDSALSFLPVTQFPTVAHIDLLGHNLIDDPFIDSNEIKSLWVNEADWIYRTSEIPKVQLSNENEKAVLVFEGLDTVVDVYLNGHHILFSNNMHIGHRVDVTHLLKHADGKSVLELRFRNAPAFAREEKDRIGYKCKNPSDVHFGGAERLFLRKAQYHWGWDWGPSINTAGPWKPVYLQIYQQRISEFIIRQQVSEDLTTADIIVVGSVEFSEKEPEATVEVFSPTGELLQQNAVELVNGNFNMTIAIDEPLLWFPHLYGDQPLYKVTVSLGNGNSKSQHIGLRRLKLVQNPLKNSKGRSFVFEINNIRIFAGGSCWIPGDCMLPRMDRHRYSKWLKLAKSGNQTMIRVWGGGIVESDDFYDLCDREGLLVWQDFLFACGNYPASPDFLRNVEVEAETQLKRVGHHASLVLWAGNNEDYLLAERFGWDLDMSDEEGPWNETNFPAREIYERLLPRLVESLGGDVPYWPSSPYGGSFSNDTTVGDTHIWDVWHGKISPYQDYQNYTSRFISEFGFESCPSLRTLCRAITVPSERHAQSRLFDNHDKGPGHTRRYPMYMGENFRFRMNPLRDFVYCTQFLQAEAMSYAYNCWRREFRGFDQEYCAGALVWQMNDIWPGASWALVDVDLNPKPAFYVTKRALAKVVLGMSRITTKQPPYIITGYLPEKHSVDIWAVNGTLERLDVTLNIRAYDIESGKRQPLPTEIESQRLDLPSNQALEITNISIPNAENTVIVGSLHAVFTGERLARWVSWPEPLKYIQLSPELIVSAHVADSGDKILLSSNAPVKGVILAVPISESGEDAIFEDNFVDLVPEEVVEVEVQGLGGRKVETRFLYDWEMQEGFEL